MTIDTENQKEMLRSILESISRIDVIKPSDIPNIDLYMDQVTTFMDTHLGSSRRYPDDKVLTKTMINNYAKNNLLPPPVKKKYSREHILLLIFIYYFKGFLSFSDIQALLSPLTEKYFHSESEFTIQELYDEVFSMEKSRIDALSKDIASSFRAAEQTFSDWPEEDQEFLHLFSFICLLSFDVYMKKQIIEKLIDGMTGPDNDKKKK